MFDYTLEAVEPANAPEGARSDSWHRYVIANRITSITGYRAGSKTEVAEYARQCIQRLNSRHRPVRRQ